MLHAHQVDAQHCQSSTQVCLGLLAGHAAPRTLKQCCKVEKRRVLGSPPRLLQLLLCTHDGTSSHSRSKAPKCEAKNSTKGTVTINRLCSAMFTTVLGSTAGKDSVLVGAAVD